MTSHPTEPKLPESLEVVREALRTAAIEIARANHYGWGNVCLDAADAISDAESALKARDAEIERLRGDAERYQWLRSTTNTFTNDAGERIDVKLHPEQWDAAIDQARATGGEKAK